MMTSLFTFFMSNKTALSVIVDKEFSDTVIENYINGKQQVKHIFCLKDAITDANYLLDLHECVALTISKGKTYENVESKGKGKDTTEVGERSNTKSMEMFER